MYRPWLSVMAGVPGATTDVAQAIVSRQSYKNASPDFIGSWLRFRVVSLHYVSSRGSTPNVQELLDCYDEVPLE